MQVQVLLMLHICFKCILCCLVDFFLSIISMFHIFCVLLFHCIQVGKSVQYTFCCHMRLFCIVINDKQKEMNEFGVFIIITTRCNTFVVLFFASPSSPPLPPQFTFMHIQSQHILFLQCALNWKFDLRQKYLYKCKYAIAIAIKE